MVNELTSGQITYGYDEFSNLVWSHQDGQFDFLHRNVNDVGNLYETTKKTDRVYGAGSRLLETREAIFSYDEEGNLVQKVEKNGDTWKYEYNGNGIMSKVVLFSQKELVKEVKFQYDPLARRVVKSCGGKTTHFMWDGNTILHEWVDDRGYTFEPNTTNTSTNIANHDPNGIAKSLVTWIFDPETFWYVNTKSNIYFKGQILISNRTQVA